MTGSPPLRCKILPPKRASASNVALQRGVTLPKPRRFTRIPLPAEFSEARVPREAIATYTVLASYANNKSGLCWPKMSTLASTLNCSVRTVQRHLAALRRASLVEFVERRRVRGRYSSYLYRLVHYVYFTTGHPRPPVSRSSNTVRTKPSLNREEEAEKRKEGYEWLFQ